MRHLRTLLVVVIVLAALAIPATASAKVDDSYKGWGTVAPATGNYWAPGWAWYSYYGWWHTYRYDNDRVWIQPFASGWSWTWNAGGGWMAMRTGDLDAAATTTGVKGTVTITHRCPVEPCPASNGALPSITLTFTGSDGARHYAYTDGYGAYSTALAAGTYKVTANIGIAFSASVTVPGSGYLTRNFTIDSGIR